jgi:hypothetical protein
MPELSEIWRDIREIEGPLNSWYTSCPSSPRCRAKRAVFSYPRSKHWIYRWLLKLLLTRAGKMSVFCLTNQNPLSVLLGNAKSIVHIGPALFIRLLTEIAIDRPASILYKLSYFWDVFGHIISEFMIGRTTKMIHRQALNAWQRPFVCLLFILLISNDLHCLSSISPHAKERC